MTKKHNFFHFMNGFAAATQLAHRASANGYMIEFIILSASVIDGTLRVGLVLQDQITTETDNIPDELIYQGTKDRGVSEREIYRRALARSVIDKELFDELQGLYGERNRVVHRYIISDITTEHVFNIARRYEDVINRVSNAVWILEDRQSQLGVGMTRKSPKYDARDQIDSMVQEKHGADWLSRALGKRTSLDDN